ncbi:hypothetical protein K505DRAFT_342140 [Melanomma pulvis-pyrius CBS 109.77]|uniref:Uncharacterized protein n=1 Tax=Melanomma pulvis-pyrius CBS 109.77 TaxID=1314802 RepID=A0A6A6WWV9_9PLEO|nr:hypothetical protein K505DRAFT_342140 [Melanomma pulvis-pyrius CBS 109.77]
MHLPTLLLAALPLASAWRLQLYAAKDYVTEIEDRSGTLTQPCKNLAAGKTNVVSSFHWYPGSLAKEVILFDAKDCKGNIIWDTNTETHIKDLSKYSGKNDKVESYNILL